jgi:predicted Zn-dependent protease
MRKKLAAQNYRRARQLIEDKDYHPAVEMLREAVRFVPDNAEYRYVLAQVEMKNPNWIDQGLANLKEAARLDSRRVAYSAEAARALVEHKRAAEAEPFARRAVSLDPSPENEALLQRTLDPQAGRPAGPPEAAGTELADVQIEPAPSDESGPSATPGSLLSRLFRRG